MGKKKIGNKLEVACSNLIDRICQIAMYLATGLLICWGGLFTICLVLRDFFHISVDFLEEYTAYWMLTVTCLALAYTLRSGEHIRIDTVTRHLNTKVRNVLELLGTLIGLGVTVALTTYGSKLLLIVINEGSRSLVFVGIPLWPVYLWVPVGYGLLSLALLLHLYAAMKAIRKEWSTFTK